MSKTKTEAKFNEKVLLCPFCYSDKISINTHYNHDEPEIPISWIECSKCKARGPAIISDSVGAILAWNSRTLYKIKCPKCGKVPLWHGSPSIEDDEKSVFCPHCGFYAEIKFKEKQNCKTITCGKK